MVCNKLDNDEMLECEETGCGAWVHNKCENLTEEEALDIVAPDISDILTHIEIQNTTDQQGWFSS